MTNNFLSFLVTTGALGFIKPCIKDQSLFNDNFLRPESFLKMDNIKFCE